MLAQLKPMIKNALISGGSAAGRMSGIPGMSMAGGEIGKRISRLVGSGDYSSNEVSTNNLINPKGADPTSQFGKDSLSIRIRHREFLGDVSTGGVAGVFTNNSFNINPGLRATFPYLSQIATNFEMYCVKGLVFEFISSASPYVSSGTLGTVIGSCEYNAASPLYASKFAMENSSMSVSTRLDKNLMYGIECAPGNNAQNCYYVRSGASSSAVNLTDMGIFQLGLAPGASVPTNSVVGELWVAYDIELSRPYLELSRNGTYNQLNTTVASATPLGSVLGTPTTNGNLNNVVLTATGFTLPDGVVGDCFLVTVSTQFAVAGAFTTYPTWTGSGCAVRYAVKAPATGGSNTNSVQEYVIQITGASPSVALSGASYAGTGASTASVVIVSLGNYPSGFSFA